MFETTKILCMRSCLFSKESGFQKTGFILDEGKEYKVPDECTKRNAKMAIDSGWAKDISIERKILKKIEKKIQKNTEKKYVDEK